MSFADNGRMLQHYHLEFNRPLDRGSVAAVLQALSGMDAGVGRPLLSTADVEKVLSGMPPGGPGPAVALSPMALPAALPDAADRALRRDELEGGFIALSSANTEGSAIENMHMNGFRPAEALLECLSDGHTAVMADLEAMEAHAAGNPAGQFSVSELVAIERGLREAAKAIAALQGSTESERAAWSARFTAGANQARLLLR